MHLGVLGQLDKLLVREEPEDCVKYLLAKGHCCQVIIVITQLNEPLEIPYERCLPSHLTHGGRRSVSRLLEVF